jgi:hypothetical protein
VLVQIPATVAAQLGQACYDVFKSERALIEFGQRSGVTLEQPIGFVNGG